MFIFMAAAVIIIYGSQQRHRPRTTGAQRARAVFSFGKRALGPLPDAKWACASNSCTVAVELDREPPSQNMCFVQTKGIYQIRQTIILDI